MKIAVILGSQRLTGKNKEIYDHLLQLKLPHELSFIRMADVNMNRCISCYKCAETKISEAKAVIQPVPDMPDTETEILEVATALDVIDYSVPSENLANSQAILEKSIKQYALVNNPTEAYVISCLEQISDIVDISAVTEDNDPNGNLNKAGGYTATVFFSHAKVNQSEVYGVDLIDKGTAAGGQIEVYATVEDAKNRNSYLATFDGGMLASGSHIVVGTVLVRTSDELTASQQKELEAKIIEVLTYVEA